MNRKQLVLLAVVGLLGAFAINLIGQDRVDDRKSPKVYQVKFETTAGDFVIEVHREWAPRGADRFFTLVTEGFYDQCKFYRVIKSFMVQFGINGDPKVSAQWMPAKLKDDPVLMSNKRGYVTFAKAPIPNSRSTQVFINYVDNRKLDSQGFSPFGEVVEGMDVVDSLYGEYGAEPTDFQPQIFQEGNRFLQAKYPKLDSIKAATIVKK